jgi:hypothetical protein
MQVDPVQPFGHAHPHHQRNPRKRKAAIEDALEQALADSAAARQQQQSWQQQAMLFSDVLANTMFYLTENLKSGDQLRVVNISLAYNFVARGVLGDRPVTRTIVRRFEALRPTPARASAGGLEPGLSCASYEVPESIKDCAGITASGTKVGEGVAEVPSVAIKPREEYFGLVLTGFIEVPADGLYRFFVDSDDGSVLKLHGRTLVDNDGLHSATEKSGAIALEKGLHPVEILMFEDAGQDLLRVSWRGPGMDAKAIVPASAWKR